MKTITEPDRLSYFGGGVVANLMGHGSLTPVEQLAIYRGERERKPFTNQDGIDFGNTIEAHLIRRYGAVRGVKVHHSQRFIRHPEFPFIGGHPDGYVCASPIMLEAKAVSHWFGLQGGWGQPGSDVIPAPYYDQGHTYMAIRRALFLAGLVETDWTEVHYPTFWGEDLTYRDYVVQRHDGYCDTIISTLCTMWEHLQKGTYPEPTTLGDVRIIYPQSSSRTVEANDEMRNLAHKLLEVQNVKSVAEDGEKKIKFRIAQYMGDAEALVSGETVLVTHKTNAHGSRTMLVKERALNAA